MNKLYWIVGLLVLSFCVCVSGACIDGDGGLNYNIASNVTVNNKSYFDYCINSTTVVEKYCFSGNVSDNLITCVGGYCSNGACVSYQNCTDTDNGIVPNLTGTVTSKIGEKYRDLWFKAGSIWAYDEYFCVNYTEVGTVRYVCNQTMVPLSQLETNCTYCSDTDGGINPSFSGQAYDSTNKVSYGDNFAFLNNKYIYSEYFCSMNLVKTRKYDCGNTTWPLNQILSKCRITQFF